MFDTVAIEIRVVLVHETQRVDLLPFQRHNLDEHSSGSCDEHTKFLNNLALFTTHFFGLVRLLSTHKTIDIQCIKQCLFP